MISLKSAGGRAPLHRDGPVRWACRPPARHPSSPGPDCAAARAARCTRRPGGPGSGSCWRIMTHDDAQMRRVSRKSVGVSHSTGATIPSAKRRRCVACWRSAGSAAGDARGVHTPAPEPQPGALALSPGYTARTHAILSKPDARGPMARSDARDLPCHPAPPPPAPSGVAGTDSHGLTDPIEHKVKRPWLTPALPHGPELGRATGSFGPACGAGG